MSWIQTFSGRKFDFGNPFSNGAPKLADIARAFPHINRYNGHTRRPYSVAEHSIHVMRCVKASIDRPMQPGPRKKLLAAALMHDAAEAYVGDVSSPLKLYLGDHFRKLEKAITLKLEQFFALPPTSMECIKRADKECLAAEVPQVFDDVRDDWPLGKAWPGCEVQFWAPTLAEARFLQAARELGLGRVA